MTSPTRAVVFDYGGVMTLPVRDSIAAWIRADDIVPESFTTVLREWLGRYVDAGTPIHRLELGELPVEEFDRLLAERLETYAGTPVDPKGVLERLFAGMRPDPAMWALARDLRAAGVRVALLSNSWGDFYDHGPIEEMFEVAVISEQVGLRKPDPAIFRLVLDKLGLDAGECVFIDDAEPNIVGARDLGLVAVLHEDAATTRAALAQHVPALGGAA
ncbi:putative hydrolase of the HAD superfamily [Nocardioides albertanoniae]|uniref:Putative hydrolase of the HAD superfamily n=1 Tax=Nocardioides albertanoniae TaxID=1175486 RepID=A0A543ACA7_9ACTN|nr:HAD family phosphatase [Nocardioides albertanoniae]TQL70223.1 putative hydrolase of the HAD superfamily [Nocardioides albertanoniae]